MDDVKAKLDSVHKLLKKQASFAEDVEAEAFIMGKGDESLKHHVNAIIDNDFLQVVKEEKLQEGVFEVESSMSFGEEVASCATERILTHEEFAAKHPYPPKPLCIKKSDVNRRHEPAIDRQTDSTEDQHNYCSINRRPPLYLLNNFSQQSDDATESMQVDQNSEKITLRRRKEKVPNHLKRGANEKGMDSFTKKVLRIPLDNPFEEAYFTHRLWMFFRETKETEHDIHMMFNQVKEKMKQRITLKKKSDPVKFAVPYHLGLKIEPSDDSFTFVDYFTRNSRGIIRNLEVQIGNALVPVDFHVLDNKLNMNSSLLLGRAFMATVGAVCNMQTNQLCITMINLDVYYDPVRIDKPQTSNTRLIQPQTSIDYHYGDTINKQGDYSIGNWADDSHHESFAVDTALPEMRFGEC
ncbi:hypothetical protein F2Q70_00038562 [Brassica cretica]|uniref:Uncharacterized protein n=1 Tax=Brassica cretica TaxID=69181 RepID=A0A8S9K208_BRACR|nr:hypothetical protein F2Q70_00038562 [Brassica cretica]